VIFGLFAGIGWGAADLWAAILGRRIGSLPTVFVAQLLGLLTLTIILIGAGLPVGLPRSDVLVLVLNGVGGGWGYVMYYRALELGPVALVVPIVAAYPAIPIALAVLLLGESLAGAAVAGVILSLVGVVLASAEPRTLRDTSRRLSGAGVPHALVATTLFGVATFIVGRYAQVHDWAAPVLYSRVGDVVVISTVAWLSRRRITVRPNGTDVLTAWAIGVVDVCALVLYAWGAQLTTVSAVAAASVTIVLIPVLGGFAVFRERPVKSQWIGVFLVSSGVVLLALGG
jgi:drug/metabolite transporter (DMT)-like permease